MVAKVHFCCMLGASNPGIRADEAGRRPAGVVRAILRATDLCVSAPTKVARQVVDHVAALPQTTIMPGPVTLSDVPYGRWRDLRSGGYHPLLCFAPARSRNDQIRLQIGILDEGRRLAILCARGEARARMIPMERCAEGLRAKTLRRQ